MVYHLLLLWSFAAVVSVILAQTSHLPESQMVVNPNAHWLTKWLGVLTDGLLSSMVPSFISKLVASLWDYPTVAGALAAGLLVLILTKRKIVESGYKYVCLDAWSRARGLPLVEHPERSVASEKESDKLSNASPKGGQAH